MAQKFTVPISIKQLSSAGSDALTIFVNGEAYGRLKVEAGGRISWSDGTGVYDTNLYRIGANVLGTDDAFKASAGLITATSSGAPTSLIADGALAVDTTNDALYIRTNASWKKVQGGATVSAGAPTSPVQGDLWWDSDISELFVYYNNAWVAVADISVDTLDDLGDVVITTPKAGQMLAYDGTQWVNSVMPSGEPIGHLNRTASVMSFDEETRTFSISPTGASYEVWCKGIKYTKTATETVTIPDTSGLYYIYFSNTGVLSYKTTFFDWENDTPTSYIYWNAVDNKAYFFADERHGITLDWATHEYLHRTRGAVIASGFGANNYIVDGNGSLDSHAKLDIANGTFFDEDLEVNIVHSSTPAPNSWQQKIQGGALIPVFYHSGVGQWIKDVATVFPLKQGTARAQFNSYDIGSLTWSTTDIAPNKFGISWIIATNNLNEPIIAVLGQDSYNTIGEAEASVWEDLNLDGFPIFEFRPLHKVIYETSQTYANTPKARFVGIYDLRRATSSGDSIASTPVSDHGSMTGLLDDDHPQYLTDSRHNALDHSTAMGSVVLDDISDVAISTPQNGDFLRYNGSSWVNDPVNLTTDTVGDYVQNLVAGTGISLANNSGEGATPTINLSASIDDLSDVTITSVSTGQVLKWNGSAWVNSADNTGTTINSLDDIGDVVITSVSTGQVLKWNGTAWVNSSDDTGTTINALDDIGNVTAPTPSSGDFLKWNGTAWVNDVIDLGTDTTGNYLSGVSAGTGISVTHTPGEGSTATVGLNATLDNLSDVTISSVTIGQVLKWNGTAWVNDADSGGSTGSTITASDTAPSSPSDGDMWWNTAELELFVYASSAWVQVTENANQVTDLADLFDVSGTFPTNGQFLSYDNVDGEWKPTDISSGTGISIARTGGITPETTISLDASLDDLSDVSVAGVSANEYLKWSGSSWVADYPNARVTTGVTPPLTPSEGDLWLKTDELLIFVYYSSSWVQVSSDASSTVEELTDLVDVEIGDFPNFRDVLMWDGANWSNSYPNARIYANVTSPSFPVEGDMWLKTDELIAFVYYSGTWVQLTGTEESVEELGDLIDVSVVEPMEGQVLTWDSGGWVNKDIATSFSPPSLTYIRSAGIASTETLIENRLTFTPITVGGCRISTIGAASAIGNAGAIVRLGIYRSDESGFPGELLYDAGTIEPVGNSTFYPIAIPPWVNLYLTAGRYWLAAVAQDGSPNMYVVDNLETASSLGFQRTFISSPSGSNPFDLMSINPGVIYQDGVSGALPLTATPKYDNSQLTACSVAVQIF